MERIEYERVLVTGTAGFIGFHVAQRLLQMGKTVVGVDNLNPYYDVRLKQARTEILEKSTTFHFYKLNLEDYEGLERVFKEHEPEVVCNLAAQAGVRYSLTDPFSYERSNVEGFLNILELCRKYPVKNLVYASSSSVYGNNQKIPFRVEDRVDTPISLYAATKKANELMAHAYCHLFRIPTTGLRYFTVYGPWGRPDMALFLFTDAILKGRPIDVYNYGNMRRDFTYIDDIVDGTLASLERAFRYEIFNLGNSKPVELMDFIQTLERELGMEAQKNLLPIQPGDVPETAADIEKSRQLLGYEPKVTVAEGIREFVAWYRDYYKV